MNYEWEAAETGNIQAQALNSGMDSSGRTSTNRMERGIPHQDTKERSS